MPMTVIFGVHTKNHVTGKDANPMRMYGLTGIPDNANVMSVVQQFVNLSESHIRCGSPGSLKGVDDVMLTANKAALMELAAHYGGGNFIIDGGVNRAEDPGTVQNIILTWNEYTNHKDTVVPGSPGRSYSAILQIIYPVEATTDTKLKAEAAAQKVFRDRMEEAYPIDGITPFNNPMSPAIDKTVPMIAKSLETMFPGSQVFSFISTLELNVLHIKPNGEYTI